MGRRVRILLPSLGHGRLEKQVLRGVPQNILATSLNQACKRAKNIFQWFLATDWPIKGPVNVSIEALRLPFKSACMRPQFLTIPLARITAFYKKDEHTTLQNSATALLDKGFLVEPKHVQAVFDGLNQREMDVSWVW